MPTADVFVSTDNALGSPRGDVDDAFAVAALLAGGARVLASTFGNTSEELAHRNNRALAGACAIEVEHLRGATGKGAAPSEVARRLASHEGRVAALGPLTDVAAALAIGPCRWSEAVVVGGNLTSWGRVPPLWPMEFNFTADRRATQAVFASHAPLTVVPLDVARRLTISAENLEPIPGTLGILLRQSSKRWFRRARIRRLSSRFAVWDLAAAMWLTEPGLFQTREIRARATRLGRIAWNEGRSIRVLTSFDRDAVWSAFLRLVTGPRMDRWISE